MRKELMRAITMTCKRNRISHSPLFYIMYLVIVALLTHVEEESTSSQLYVFIYSKEIIKFS